MWDVSDHDSNPSQTMTLTACPVALSDHYSNPSQTMTLTATPKPKLPGNSTWALGPSLPAGPTGT